MSREKEKLQSQLLMELHKGPPVIQVAVKKVGISRATFYRWRNQDPVFYQMVLETIEEISRHAPTIMNQVVIERAMPLGNQTGMTDAERDLLAAWIEGRK